MQLDIRSTLRRLLLAGVPLIGACNQGAEGARTVDLLGPSRGQACTERPLPYPGVTGAGSLRASLVIDPEDDRWADFYSACVERERYCPSLCSTALQAANLVPAQHSASLVSCSLSSCTEQGKPVLYVTYNSGPTGVPGRRPAGLADPLLADGDPCGAWLARAAAFEAASVPAFSHLARELAAHGAPADLVSRSRAAMADEARHFRMMRQLALSYGTAVSRPRAPSGPVRPLLEVAIENAVEGCVNETYAALVALWQSTHAADPAVREAMVAIAEDETRHAQLSWDVTGFALSRLAPDEVPALAAAFVDAGRRLLASEAAAPPADPRLTEELGLPDPAAALSLVTGLLAALPGAAVAA